MSTVSSPSYLLAPNWSYSVDGPIALGNLVIDPVRPYRAITKLTADPAPPPTWTSVELDKHLEVEKIRAATASLWTKVLNVADAELSARRSSTGTIAFDMSRLETTYFEPSVEYVAARAQDPRLSTILASRKGLRRSCVYMVTGLKVARDFRFSRTDSTDRGVKLGAGAQATPQLSTGGSVELSQQTRRAEESKLDNDIIFAYQVIRIRRCGRGEDAGVEMHDFKDSASFLADKNDGEDEEDTRMELDKTPEDDLVELHEGTVFSPDEEQHAWIFSGK